MQIDTVKEQLSEDGKTVVGYLLNEKYWVPIDLGNRHYQAILEWIAKGNTPEEADPPIEPPVPIDWDAIIDNLDLSGLDKITEETLKNFFKQIGTKLK